MIAPRRELDRLSPIIRELIAKAKFHGFTPIGRTGYMNSTKIPLCREQEHGAFNGHFESFASGQQPRTPCWSEQRLKADWLHWPQLMKKSIFHNAMNMQQETKTNALNKAL